MLLGNEKITMRYKSKAIQKVVAELKCKMVVVEM